MAAGNTSAFNCRQVVNRPGVRSPHSYGRSLDINTWENPYRSPTGLVPNSWWQRHSHPLVAWRSRAHPVVRIMARHGLRWTYGMSDTQHFDATGAHGRVMVYPGCEASSATSQSSRAAARRAAPRCGRSAARGPCRPAGSGVRRWGGFVLPACVTLV